MRDDFNAKTKDILGRRVGFRCSNPNCRKLTTGPQTDENKVITIGVAAHITAASKDGPRFDINKTPTERMAGANGIWLCQNCAKLVDNDKILYTIDLLIAWKEQAERDALQKIENTISPIDDSSEVINANVSLIPISLDSDNVYALIKIKNNEQSKKITNCRAKLINLFTTCNDKDRIIDFTGSITAIEFPFFYWRENHEKQIDIDPLDEKILCIALTKENKSIHLTVLKDDYNFPVTIISNGKKMCEIRFKIEIIGNIGNERQVFYKPFCGKVVYTVTQINEMGKEIFIDDIAFDEVNEQGLVE
jgi:hypothetical protein